MKNMLVKIIVGTLFHCRKHPKTAAVWKFAAWSLLTLNFMLNVSTILIILNTVLIKLNIGRLHVVVFEDGLPNRIFVFFAMYTFVGIVVYFSVFYKKKYNLYLNNYPKFRSSKYPTRHFFGSFAALFIVFTIAIRHAIEW